MSFLKEKLSNNSRYYIELCRVLVTEPEIISQSTESFPAFCFGKKGNYYNTNTEEYLIQSHKCILPEFIIQYHHIPKLHYHPPAIQYPIDLRSKEIILPPTLDFFHLDLQELCQKNHNSYLLQMPNPFEVVTGLINYDDYSISELNENALAQCGIIHNKAKSIYPSIIHKLFEIEQSLFDRELVIKSVDNTDIQKNTQNFVRTNSFHKFIK